MVPALAPLTGETSHSRLGRKLQRLQLHRITASDHVDDLAGSSFGDTGWAFLSHLRNQGRVAAETWLM